jgi:hypothetical protein
MASPSALEGQGHEGLATCLFPGGNSPAVLGILAVSVMPRQADSLLIQSCYSRHRRHTPLPSGDHPQALSNVGSRSWQGWEAGQ